MFDRKLQSWFYPESTGDVGRDRNARTLQFSCFLLAFAVGAVLIVGAIGREWQETPLLVFAIAGFIAAAVMNRAGRSDWAGRTAFLVVLLGAILLVFQAHDGFRSHSMLVFPGLLLISVMMLDRASYVMTGGIVVVAVAALGIAAKHGLTRATTPVRTTYDSIFYVDLNLLVIAIIGSRIARDTQTNVTDLRTIINQLSAANLESTKIAEALRESEERFRAAFYQAAVGIAQTSLDGCWMLVNDRLSEILGYSSSELNGRTFLDITHPGDREANLKARRQFLAGEISSWSVEKRYIHKNGATVWARVHVSLVRDQHYVPQYFISVVEDITDRVEAERALHASERLLALAQSAGQLGLWSYDLRTKAVVASRENFQLYGLPADHARLTYEEWLRLIHPDDRERVKAAVQESIEGTHVWDTEFRAVWPDGSVRWLLGKGTAFLDDSGQPVRLAGVNLDITERKQAEEVRSHLADIVESSNDAIISKTLDGVIMSWNPGAERIYGYKAEEIVGLPISSLVPPDRPDEIPPIVERLRHGERLEQYETTRVRKDGRRIEVSVTISPIRDSTGAVLGASVIARDITEQKRAEAMLRRNLDEIAHLNRVAAMGELTASLAHELNQPLAAILSNAQAAGRFLGGESPDLVQVRECLTDIVADDKRAAEVIRRLRGLLKKEAAQRSSVDLNEVVSEAIRLLRNDAMLRNVSVKVEPFAGLPPVLGDRIQLYQVALNLIVNGVDAVAERPPENRWVLVRTAASHGGGVELTVEDSGKGIADGDLSRVFEPFFSTKQEGLGMGLSICRSIVEAHGGRIWAERRAGPGAVFRCLLPVAQRATAASAK